MNGAIFAEKRIKNMRFRYFITSVLLLILLTAGCKKSLIRDEGQAMLFQYDYVNNAWGSQHYGFIIDKDGNVLTYNNPEEWNFADNDLIITGEQVSENLNMCSYSGTNVPEEELRKYEKYIKYLALSKISALRNTGADAGTASFICYEYSENPGTYKGTIIKMEGDFSCENLNFYSKKIASWMKDIHNNLPRD